LTGAVGATILSFDRDPVGPVDYADLEHVTITRDFLNDPGAFLRQL
jgi:predicted ATPase